ncbi:TetR/AcrR family transcriptional regulator C-terminal domain-containing protein [Leucobacter tardus]
MAAELNVNPASLYNHVPNRAAMIEDVRALVSARIVSAPLRELTWEDGLREWARSYRLAFAQHPLVVPILMTTPASSSVLLAEYEDFAIAAQSVGWSSSEVLPLLTAFESFILGSVLDLAGPAVMFDPAGQEASFPNFARAYASLSEEDPQDPVATRAFEMGLSMLVANARPRSAT